VSDIVARDRNEQKYVGQKKYFVKICGQVAARIVIYTAFLYTPKRLSFFKKFFSFFCLKHRKNKEINKQTKNY